MFLKNYRGFGIVGAIFILVILATAGAYLLSIAGLVTRGTDFSLLSAQADMAAMSGLEWGMYKWNNGASCSNTPTVLNLSGTPLSAFTVTVSMPCSTTDGSGAGSSTHVEGTKTYSYFTVISTAQLGTFGVNPTYVSRQLSTTVVR